MTTDIPENIFSLDHKEKARLLVDFFHRVIMHHGLWFSECVHQMGMEGALEALGRAWPASRDIQMSRLSKTLGFGMAEHGVPQAVESLSGQALDELIRAVAVNWLANDGVWFQAVESRHGMYDAKRANDTCWSRFAPLEAWAIKRFLGLADDSGLTGLKKALAFRLYAVINVWSIADEGPDAFVFTMNECRVQSARRRKGMEDYPCKSGGLVEYTSFARAMDHRIACECVGCPPDPHPQEWACSWRFSIQACEAAKER